MSEVSNQGLDQVAIDMDKMWRKRERAKGMEPITSLREKYTQVEITLPTQLQYSKVL